MANAQNPNLEILELAVHQLGELADDLAFAGGCATGLLLTDPAAAPVRATYDVDAIAQVLSRAEYYRFAEKERDAGPAIRLVTMTIDTDDIDVTLDEAILKDGECVGYVTSGGYAHHVQQSMALVYVPAELAADGTELEVEINGEMYAAKVVGKPLYDPSGDRMRG